MGEYRDVSSANQEVVFFGNCSAIFGYITGIGMIPGVDYPQHDCDRNIKAIQHLLEQKKPVIFLCPRNPGIEGLSVENYPNVDTLLINNGYHDDVKQYYSVYYPNM